MHFYGQELAQKKNFSKMFNPDFSGTVSSHHEQLNVKTLGGASCRYCIFFVGPNCQLLIIFKIIARKLFLIRKPFESGLKK